MFHKNIFPFLETGSHSACFTDHILQFLRLIMFLFQNHSKKAKGEPIANDKNDEILFYRGPYLLTLVKQTLLLIERRGHRHTPYPSYGHISLLGTWTQS